MAIRLSEFEAQLAAQMAPIRKEREVMLRAIGPGMLDALRHPTHSAAVRALTMNIPHALTMTMPRDLSVLTMAARTLPWIR